MIFWNRLYNELVQHVNIVSISQKWTIGVWSKAFSINNRKVLLFEIVSLVAFVLAVQILIEYIFRLKITIFFPCTNVSEYHKFR